MRFWQWFFATLVIIYGLFIIDPTGEVPPEGRTTTVTLFFIACALLITVTVYLTTRRKNA